MADASTTYRPSTLWTCMLSGSTTSISSSAEPILAVDDGRGAVLASFLNDASLFSSVVTAAACDVDPLFYSGFALGHLAHLVGIQQLAGHVDGLAPLAAILLGLQVVEEDLRLLVRVGALDLHVAGGIGVHRADVELKAVLTLRLATVVADGHREE